MFVEKTFFKKAIYRIKLHIQSFLTNAAIVGFPGGVKSLSSVTQMGILRRAHSVSSVRVVIMYLLLEIWNKRKH